jgi:hypothetical protein
LSEYGIRHIEMPATPQRVWEAIRDAKRSGAADPLPAKRRERGSALADVVDSVTAND